jgi:hypothetical protein
MLGKPARLNMPRLYNLISDPKEEYNLVNIDHAFDFRFSMLGME